MIGDREHEYTAGSEQEMSVVTLPWHYDLRFEIDNTALLMEMCLYSTEIVEQYSEAVQLFTHDKSDLVKLEFMKYFFICRYHVFVKTGAVDKDLNIDTLHMASLM